MEDDVRLKQLEDKLEQLTDAVDENTEILRSMQRTARWSFWGRLLIWIIVLVLPFIVLGPLLKTLVPSLGTTGSGGVFGLPSQEQVEQLIKDYKQGAEQLKDSSSK